MDRRLALSSFLVGWVGLSGICVVEAAAPRIPEPIAQAMQDRDFAKALAAIDAALKDPQTEHDRLLYLKGRAHHFLEQDEQAIQTYDLFAKLHAESPLARRVRFAKAVSLVRLGEFQRGEAIYRAEAERLLSSDRKQQIADIYLEFANAYFDPPQAQRAAGQTPNYAKALEFFTKALEAAPATERRLEVVMRIGQSLQSLGQHAEAEQRYLKVLRENPDSPHELEARFRLGEAQRALGKNAAARRTWEDLLAKHAEAKSERLAEAAYNIALTYHAIPAPDSAAEQQTAAQPGAAQPGAAQPGAAQQAAGQPGAAQQATPQQALPQPPDPFGATSPNAAPGHNENPFASPDAPSAQSASLDLAITRYRAFLKQHPAHKLASAAFRQISLGQMAHRRYRDAAATIVEYLQDARYADREETPELRYQLGHCLLLQKEYDEAIAVWQEFLTRHSAHRRWSDAQRQIIETEYLMAQEQQKAKKFAAARQLYLSFLAKHPLDSRAPRIAVTLGQLNSQQEEWAAAIADWRRVVAKHPQTDEASLAQFLIGAALEERLHQHQDALKEYGKLDWGTHRGQARQRIARLTAKQLVLRTERVFRSDETPQIAVETRNIDQLQVRVYRIDLETYFRKMHLARGVEQLDISLIDPDHSFEFAVPDYAEYAPARNAIELKLPAAQQPDGAGGDVLVVTVSSQTLEATTMVLQSDLDILAKCSRDEVFVFAQNMRTGKPWAEAKVLVSNGENVFAEVRTGADGVYQGVFPELRDAADVRVFAVSGGNTASNVVDLNGVGVAQGLENKGYLYTDRPAYRPGHLVNLRGVIRKVSADTYSIEPGKKFDLLVLDSRGRQVWTEQVALNDFGAFHARLRLPDAAPVGEYRIQLTDQDKQSYHGQFVVEDYRSENVRLEIDTARAVYYRGEVIRGTLRASYYYGAPVAEREIRYEWSDGASHSALTDARGEVAFEFDTRELHEHQGLTLVAALPEMGLRRAKSFVIAAQEYSLAVRTPRRNAVYLAGESFEATLSAFDAEGEPAGKRVRLQVLHETDVDGVSGERMVSEHAAQTDAATGEARVTLALPEAGRYFLRAVGEDRFGNTVTGQSSIQVSGDDDSVRLRLLAERHSFKAGDTPEIKIHWREKPALGIVTFQGARILDYRLVSLKTGVNVFQAPMTAQLAPNFDLNVSVMTDARQLQPAPAGREAIRLHEASSPFFVERNLLVKIEPEPQPQPFRPGQELSVKITTTDPQGQPTAAEVSLALVEQSLLRRFSDPAGPIDDFFRGNPRQSAIRTASSITFEYRPQTTTADRALLAELERLERLESGAKAPVGAVQMELFNGQGELKRLIGDAENWSGVGGPGAIEGFPSNLSLAIEQSQEVQSGEPVEAFEFGRRRFRMPALTLLSDADQDGNGLADLTRQLGELKTHGHWGFQAAFPDGHVARFSVADRTPQELEALAARLQEQGGVLLPARGWEETGYWNPGVQTDERGEAQVTFAIPERSTAWRLMSKGATAETLTGETEIDLTVSKDLFGELKLPLALTAGDAFQVVATVHNTAPQPEAIKATLRTTIGGKTATQTRMLPAQAAAATQQLAFAVEIARPENSDARQRVEARFALEVESGGQVDRYERVVEVHPFGLPVVAESTGTSSSDATAFVEFAGIPAGVAPLNPQLKIVIGPSIEGSLLSILSAPGETPSPAVETVAGHLLSALALQSLLSQTRDADHPHAVTLDRRIRGAISALIAMQDDGGGWSWCAGDSNRYVSSRALWALAQAKRGGYKIPDDNLALAVTFVQSQIAQTENTDYESKAVLLHALTVAEQSDFPLANRLYRNRESMSTAALLYLALGLAEMNRSPIALELLDLAAARGIDGAGGPAALPWNHSPVENRALFALALQLTRPQDPRAAEATDWLMEHRTGAAWAPAKATGPAALAVCRWRQRTRFERQAYQLKVVVNDREVAELKFDGDTGPQTVTVDANVLRKDKQQIRFLLTGRGHFSYQCLLEGHVPAGQLDGSTQDWQVARSYEPAPLQRDGRTIPRGFAAAQEGTFEPFRNPLTQLPVAREANVTVTLERRPQSSTPQAQREYLEITERLPSGVTLVEGSVEGDFEHFEAWGDTITFFVGQRERATIRYSVYGFLEGQCQAAPCVARDVYRPDRFAVGKPLQLKVLALGQQSPDPYRLTPDELLALGSRAYRLGLWNESVEHLSALAGGQWSLNADAAQQATRLLLDSHLEIGPPQRVVAHFEIIKEKWPEMQIPYEKILRIGQAYEAIGEFERAYLIFRATVESSFLTESRVAGFLRSQSELMRSVQFTDDLLREYPPEPYVADAEFDLAQSVYALAAQADTDERLREQKIRRDDLVRESLDRLHNYLSSYPVDPGADKAAFSLAAGQLELRQFQTALELCSRYVVRYAESRDVDSFWYTIGYCQFALGQHDQALETCRKVADMQRRDPRSGQLVAAANRLQAIYILGQIYHSLGRAAEAIKQYAEVKEEFADASEAIDFFARRDIQLPEVTTFAPGQPVALELKHRNIAAAEVKVYRIDLMKFGLQKQNLQGITNINLAGVRPFHEATLKLGDGKDYADKRREVELPIAAEGAWLVVCRGEDLHASGLVLISPLALEIQEESDSGRVRTTVKDTVEGRYVSNIHVKVIGSENGQFVSGETDLRGVFVADAIRGTSTVIAQAKSGRYAFFRGSRRLGPAPSALPAAPQPETVYDAEAAPAKGKPDLLDNLIERNSIIQGENMKRQEEQFYNDEAGVRVESVK